MIHPYTQHRWIQGTRLTALMLGFAALGIALVAAPARANAQSPRDMISRLVQSDNDAATRAFTQARSFLDEQKWAQAASTFNRYINDYPSDKNLDAALYWLAFAYGKQNKFKEAEGVLTDLLVRFPRSSWSGDAKVLHAEVKGKLGQPVPFDENDPNDELRILALRTLCENDRVGCSARVSEVLRSNKSARVKEAAIILLGRYGGNEAVPSLIQMSRSEPNEKLRMRAIRALGSTNDERALDVLRELAMSAVYDDESPTDSAIHALVEHDNARAVTILGDVAINGKNLKARQHSVEQLARRSGEPAVDELFRIYDAVQDVQIRKYVVAGLGNRKSPRAAERLLVIARTAPEVELRRGAFRSLANRGDGQYLDALLSMYDSEADNDLKNGLLQAIGQYQDRRAYQKLMQVVRNNAEPIERRKTAIQMLSRSKDPEVLEFLKDMLK
ncbi:MAG TPA: HEAT repeat domain-containing protein [Pyrinomonadaceae bacterium]|nr:HEAT repeat domain-containing protein [Pyrinomonadaceae bacterium]